LDKPLSFPQPVAGLVIRYSYLWRSEHLRGQEEGVKDRPCAVILVTADNEGDKIVTVLPITYTPPQNPALAVEIPHATKCRLGLDDERSWIVLTEANRFVWPGPDLRFSRSGDTESVAYGLLPSGLFNELKHKLVAAISANSMRVVPRTD
jgi:hypothetical protein